MNLRAGEQKKRFGEQAVGGIEGLELLQQYKDEQGSEAGDDEDWANWDLDDDGEDSDSSGGWINVQSDDDINLSDSDDESPAKKAKTEDSSKDDNEAKDETKTESTDAAKPNLATTRILTPADLAKLQELRTKAAIDAHLPNRPTNKKTGTTAAAARTTDDPLTAAEIEGLAHLSAGKLTREEKIAHAREGKTDRNEFRSATAKRQERKVAEGKSTTNKEKARKKNFMMTLGKARSKNKRSLVETRRVLKAHQDRAKRGGRRANGMRV